MYQFKYGSRDLKGDLLAGSFNGGVFGLVYSFYYLPIDRVDTKVFCKFRNNAFIYCLVNCLKMSAAFAIMRSTYNCTKKQELGRNYEIGGCLAAFALICTFM